jgi:hypothetical protein
LWQELLAGNQMDWVRRTAEYRLQQLQALDDLDLLLSVVRAYMDRTGAAPENWSQLVGAKLLTGVPVDPAGTPYLLLPGGVALAADSPLLPLPHLEERR